MNLQILTDVATEGAEVVEETFNLAEWLNTNQGVLMLIIACAGLAIYGLVRYADKRKKRK